VKGFFVWLSQRSGVFTPREPIPLSATLRLSLCTGTADIEGKPLPEWSQVVQTPPMELKGSHSHLYAPSHDARAEPQISLLFNADVQLSDAAKFCKFIDAKGVEIGAKVATADPAAHPRQSFPRWRSKDQSLLTWAERFSAKRRAEEITRGTPTGPRTNQLIVTPLQPLPLGENWRLVIAAGLPSTDRHVRLLEPAEVAVGTVRPFLVEQVNASNVINSGRQLSITFSKAIAADVTPKNLSRWVQIEPQATMERVTIDRQTITWTGDFELRQPYTITVSAGLPAKEPFVLGESTTREFTFEQVPPRLYFEAFGTQQLSSGRREFHLLAVNTPRIRVTAKLFPPETAAAAVQAYEQYQRTQQRRSDEYFSRVGVEEIAGRVVWQKELAGTEEIDEAKEIPLSWDEILGPGATGAVMITAEEVPQAGSGAPVPGAQALIQVTDLGVVWKTAPSESFVHIFSLATGRALAGAKLRLLDEKLVTLGEAISDDAGVAKLPPWKSARWLLAEKGEDVHLVDCLSWEGKLHLAGHERRYYDEDEEESHAETVLLFSDRPVYKPGETVHLKAIVRDLSGVIPAGAEVELTAKDARDRAFYTTKLTVSESGSVADDLVLPASSVGTFTTELKIKRAGSAAELTASHSFEVQEYKENAFEIRIDGAPTAMGPAQLEIPVSAKYYMGKALSKARLSWSLKAEDSGFAPSGFEKFAFCSAVTDHRLNEGLNRFGHFAEQGKTELDPTGAAIVAAAVPINARAPQPRTAELLCEITDLDQQTVSSREKVTIHASDFYLGVRQLPSVIREGEALPLQVIAVRTDGSLHPEPVQTTVRLTRVNWHTNRVEGAGETSEYRSEPLLELVSQTTLAVAVPQQRDGEWITATADPAQTFTAGKPGQYLLEAVGRDAAGRDVLTSTLVHVVGAGDAEWDYRNPFEVDLVPNKSEYLTGETATILVKTPISGQALVTIEREKVMRSFVTTLSGNAPSIEVPLEGIDAPNVFVSVMLLRGANDSTRKIRAPEYRVGVCELKVTRPESRLSIYVKPQQPSYEPGESVQVETQVLDAEGHLVAGAEVTLYAVDEGVLSLTGYNTPDPYAFFNQARPLFVGTGLTLPMLMSEDPEERSFGNKGYLIGDGGDGGNRLRKNFVACAFWSAALRTDENGRISSSFAAPDSLTRYRIIAVAHTLRDQFGSGESAFQVSKALMLQPSLPRFANVGDQLVLRAVLHNTTSFSGEAEVQLELDATVKTATTTQRVQLAAGESAAVDFPVEFVQIGQAQWKWSAELIAPGAPKPLRDRVQSQLAVRFPAPLLRQVRTGYSDAGEANLLAGFDPQLLEGEGVVRVSITNSRAIELREAIRELLHYPYGCVEQTTSSTLPWLTMRHFGAALPELGKTEAQINDAVQHGIERLLKMQTSSGGLSYWPGNTEPLFWGSAYGGLGLALAKRQGHAVPEEPFAQLCTYLSAQLRGTSGLELAGDLSPRCMALYMLALAGRAEPAYHELLFKKRTLLSAEDRALVALAICESGGPAAMGEELLQSVDRPWNAESGCFGSPSRSAALQLLAWCRLRPDAPALEASVTSLLAQKRAGHWWTTQGNAWSLLALADYFQRVEGASKGADGQLSWGEAGGAFALGGKSQTFTTSFALAKSGATPLQLEKQSGGRIYTEVAVETRPQTLAQPRQDRGYSIQRRYARVEDDGSLTELAEPRVGDRVLVTLEIDVRQHATYVAVDDPLPANLEALNPAFKSQSTRAGEVLATSWVSDFRELRADRALFFANAIAPGRYTLRYLARVCAVGTATAPAAKIEEMYQPERFGTSGTVRVTSLALK
jgi:uncharacterized protein YfaS (alpha-2-macroglobulin family)